MNFNNEARARLTEAVNVLIDRRSKTSNASEHANIDAAIAELTDTRAILNQAALLDAADAVLEATVALERVIRSARLGPFDDFVRALEGLIHRVSELVRNGEFSEHLDRAPDTPVNTPASGSSPGATSEAPSIPLRPDESQTSATARPIPDAAPRGGIDPSHDFAVLRPEYEKAFAAMAIRPEQKSLVDWHVNQLVKNQVRYRSVSRTVNNVPWAMIGVIQAMECGFNFSCHLHNGDPLTSRTKHVPAGKPTTGQPPFAWENSAVDALKLEGFGDVTDWSIPHMLYLLEKYNGFGYRNMRMPTPYLWSFSNLYEKGKYVADGRFDRDAVSRQCGAAVMLKALLGKEINLN
jgi:lysozyme family protein